MSESTSRKRGRPSRNERVEEDNAPRGATRTKKRVAIDGNRSPQAIAEEYEDPNYHRCFVADYPESPGNVQMYIDAGYEFVDESAVEVEVTTVNKASKYGHVVARAGRDGVVSYLMQQPMEYWLEDEAVRNEKIDAKDPAIHLQDLAEEFSNTGTTGYIHKNTQINRVPV